MWISFSTIEAHSFGTVLGESLCESVKSHLTSGASVCPENTVTYSAGNGGERICGDFSETTPFQRYTVSCVAATFRALF